MVWNPSVRDFTPFQWFHWNLTPDIEISRISLKSHTRLWNFTEINEISQSGVRCQWNQWNLTVGCEISVKSPILLQCSSNAPPMLLQCLSNAYPMLLPCSSNAYPMLLPYSSSAPPMILQCSSNAPPMLLQGGLQCFPISLLLVWNTGEGLYGCGVSLKHVSIAYSDNQRSIPLPFGFEIQEITFKGVE